ncbi:MAG: hypothetical protein LBV67_04455 [Streptococcaceae bacterium]|jgi:hypothetical protein|nr:hypothetical protein [Streptococcaceae bacterium]
MGHTIAIIILAVAVIITNINIKYNYTQYIYKHNGQQFYPASQIKKMKTSLLIRLLFNRFD